MRDERGSMAPLVALVVVLAGGACLVLGRLGGVANATAQAQTAADAAALAGAAEDEAAARSVARLNGGRVVRYEEDGDDVEVAVRIGEVAAVARATRQPSGDGSGERGTSERGSRASVRCRSGPPPTDHCRRNP